MIETEAAKRLSEARSRLEVLQAVGDRIPDAQDSAALLAGIVAAVQRRVEATGAMEAAMGAADAAERELGGLEADGERERLERVAQLLATRDALETRLGAARRGEERSRARLEEADRAIRDQQGRLAEAEEAVAEAEARVTAADAELAEAEQQLQHARHRDMAATLRAGLAEGDPCPVCRQSVRHVPEDDGNQALEGAERAFQHAQDARKLGEQRRSGAAADAMATKASLVAAESRTAEATADHRAAADAVGAAEQDVQQINRELGEIVGSAEPTEALSVRRSRLDELTGAVAATRRAVGQARTLHDEAIGAEQAVKGRVDDLRMRIVDASARLGGLDTVGEDPEAIRDALDALHAEWVRAQETSAAEAKLASEEQQRATARRDTLRDALGLAGPLAEELARVGAQQAVLAEEIDRAEASRAAQRELLAERDALDRRRALFARLAGDLTDARFTRFLLDEERTRLAELGSDHFQRLSGGRYRFTEDGEFGVIDLTAAEARRRADSLSGGETFLASLGLALALAEMVSRTGGRLDAFFLDEGFGTLDPEHLDLAMEGIESLVAEAPSRLVVVVSHVPELRLRLDDLIELERSPTTGNTRVVQA